MSHNIMKLNNNSFDVNSNRTESISSLTYGFVLDDATGTPPAYPRSFVVNDNALIYKSTVNNLFSTSDVEFNDWPTNTNFIESVTLKTNGTYLIQAFFMFQKANPADPNRQGFALWNGSNYISNSAYGNSSINSYATDHNMYSTVEITGGVSQTISIRIFSILGTSYNLIKGRICNHLYVERVS